MILTLKCDQASLLMSDSLDRRLLLHERIALRSHLLACRVCPVLLRQLRLIRAASQKTRGITDELPVASEATKSRWKQAIIDKRVP